MKKVYFIIIFSILSFTIAFTGCAKRGTITGGPKDTIPPAILSSHPENYQTNFNAQEIRITFNELIKVKDISKQLIISPPMKNQPTILPQGSASKFISIRIKDTLQPNTTYSFNFGQSITDNNEGNPYSQYKYVFSTGSYIDSLAIIGKIKDAVEQKPDNFVSVQLYDAQTYTDSTAYNEVPLYVTNTLDSLKFFSLENLKEGQYYIVALKDKNNNYKFDPKADKIGFLKNVITIPNDTVFELELFKEETPFKAVKPIQETNNKLYMGFEGDPKNAKIKIKNGEEDVPVRMTKFPQTGKDSVQLFIPILKADSLNITVSNGDFEKSFTTKLKELKTKDSLSITPKSTGVLHFRDQFRLIPATPIEKINQEKITLLDKDSVKVSFVLEYRLFENEIILDFQKKENQKYALTALPGAFEDFYGTINDTLAVGISTKSYTDYGNLKVNLKSVKRFPLILQILTSDGTVKESAVSTGERTLQFDAIEPNQYTLRVIYDDNGNKKWDTGNFLEKRQAEEIEYYPKEIDVRANWDVEQDF
ncbi:Ig-like domain-containing protein [Flavobacterium sp. NRK F10]|uniref:Ig-like domain-containing protein n=1 Tax=Flavobacterium sp. NRK F10 TaxID=2954931 RepID=UPI002090DBC2|nr:Ig-like domain-containing protein [Flavobacterium sp. NRK F10]MCO6174585.1 Ig-like domain-containing protein [Flavobacterium sp. NRK F10]